MKRKQRILIVEDEVAILFSYKNLLSGSRVEVDGCTNLPEALSLIEMNRYSAIITDLRLSHSNSLEGLEIIKLIDKSHPEIPVLVQTAYGNDELRDRVLALGALQYFSKPVAIETLISCLHELGIPSGIR